MAEEVRNEQQQTQTQLGLTPEELQRLKNEIEEEKRKRQELEQLLEQQRQQNMELLAQLGTKMMTPPPTTSAPNEPEMEEDLDSLFLQKPSEAVKRILQKEKEALKKEIPQVVSQEALRIFYQEKFKQEALNKYPDLKNPNSDFYKRVAMFMYERPHLYNDPEGLLHACARVAEDMGYYKQKTFEQQRQAVASTSVEPAGGASPSNEMTELDIQGKILAQKLGISEKDMSERLNRFLKKEGEYKQEPTSGRYKAKL